MVNFLNLATLRPDISKTGGHTKKTIGYDFCYRNSYNSKFYARTRTNALQQEEHKGRGNKNYNTTCKLCGEEDEDIVHFTVKCSKLEQKRDPALVNKEIVNPIDRMKELLFRSNKHLEVSYMIRNMWILRRNLLKEIKERNLNKGQSQIRNAPKVPPGRRVTTPPNPPQSGPPQNGQASEPEINPPQSGQVLEPGKLTTQWSSRRSRSKVGRAANI